MSLGYSYNYPDTSLTETIGTGCGDIKAYSTNDCHNAISWQNAYGQRK